MDITKKIEENSKTCKPINQLVKAFVDRGFVVVKKELEEWHFNQFEIILKGKKENMPYPNINDIEKHDNCTYLCKCHWSTVKIIFED